MTLNDFLVLQVSKWSLKVFADESYQPFYIVTFFHTASNISSLLSLSQLLSVFLQLAYLNLSTTLTSSTLTVFLTEHSFIFSSCRCYCVKHDIVFKSNNIFGQVVEVKGDTNMRCWRGHVKESCSNKSQWSDGWCMSGDDEAVTFHAPPFLKGLCLVPFNQVFGC